ncbi:membrane protein [Paenibacillus swuensis]|uniref:Membrane protein n=1 Tax=Paenibacillus swuensis TaxID=1178515 RepID=A0A172TMD9_9BACL|nr:DUF3817 domain-containing protein [Paenibacillus swuensis]ANE47977.1 membrane protein [Paenibacillus swuensis]
MSNTFSLRAFRQIGIFEGISFLVLLFIAMPLKYWAEMPLAVTIVGGLHGFLFVLYLLALAVVTLKFRWSILRVFGAFIAAFLPFGTFVLESRLRKE